MRDENSLATILLASRLVTTEGVKPLNATEFWNLCDLVSSPATLLGCGEAELVLKGVPFAMARRLPQLFERSTAMAFEIDRLDQSGVATVTRFEASYPLRLVDRLGAKAPPLLYVAGDASLMDRAGLGVVGSRDVSAEAGETAKEAGQLAAHLGLAVVSGGARGVDQVAMNAALESGGRVIGFLADSLLQAVRKPDIRRAIQAGTAVMCTPYNPGAAFTAGNAMGRNKLIYASSEITFVASSDSGTGGTWAGATAALENGFGQICVWRGQGEGTGNAELEELGASPVTSINEIQALLETPDIVEQPQPPEPAVQQSQLF